MAVLKPESNQGVLDDEVSLLGPAKAITGEGAASLSSSVTSGEPEPRHRPWGQSSVPNQLTAETHRGAIE